jgi:hypothetical protein
MLDLSLFEVAHPVDRNIPTVQTAASVSIFFIKFGQLIWFLWLVPLFRPQPPSRRRQIKLT